MKPLFLIPVALAAAMGVGAYVAMQNKDDALPSTREGGPVPALTVADFQGEPAFT